MNNIWGEGIPNYNEKDLMTEEELLDFAMQNIKEFELDKNGWKIISASNDLNEYPNFVVTKDNKQYFILVRVAIAPKMPNLLDKEREIMMEYSKQHKAIPLFAPVGFGSTDPERFNKSLALRGDGYYCNYTGLQEIKELPMKEEIENMENNKDLEGKRKEYKFKITNKEITKNILQEFFDKYKFTKRTSFAELKVGATPDDGQVYVREELFTGCNFFFKFEGDYIIIELNNNMGGNHDYPLNEKNIRLVDNLVIDIKVANGYDVNELPKKHDVSDIAVSKKNKGGLFSRLFGKK